MSRDLNKMYMRVRMGGAWEAKWLGQGPEVAACCARRPVRLRQNEEGVRAGDRQEQVTQDSVDFCGDLGGCSE